MTGIFLHLGTPYIALSTVVSVVLYFVITVMMTQWRYVAYCCSVDS